MEEHEFQQYLNQTLDHVVQGIAPEDLPEAFKERIADLTEIQHKKLFFAVLVVGFFKKDIGKIDPNKMVFLTHIFNEAYSLGGYHEKARREDEDNSLKLKIPPTLKDPEHIEIYSKHMFKFMSDFIKNYPNATFEQAQQIVDDYSEEFLKKLLMGTTDRQGRA